MSEQHTPETDSEAYMVQCTSVQNYGIEDPSEVVDATFSRKLERQRDELLEALDGLLGPNALRSLCRQDGRDALGRVRGTWGEEAEENARVAYNKHRQPVITKMEGGWGMNQKNEDAKVIAAECIRQSEEGSYERALFRRSGELIQQLLAELEAVGAGGVQPLAPKQCEPQARLLEDQGPDYEDGPDEEGFSGPRPWNNYAPQAQQSDGGPVAEVTWNGVNPNMLFIRFLPAGMELSVGTKLYTAPPPADVPLLTHEELKEIIAAKSGYGGTNLIGVVRATEQLVRQKAGLK